MGWIANLFGGKPKVLPEHVSDLASYRALVLESPVPVLVDVWSETCAPCRALEPVLIEVATHYAGRIRVAEINSTSADAALLERIAVRATPTILVYDRGQELGRSSGFRPKSWFDEMIRVEFPESASSQ
jgi:thioredoxin-like negative regulator of GroEL